MNQNLERIDIKQTQSKRKKYYYFSLSLIYYNVVLCLKDITHRNHVHLSFVFRATFKLFCVLSLRKCLLRINKNAVDFV